MIFNNPPEIKNEIILAITDSIRLCTHAAGLFMYMCICIWKKSTDKLNLYRLTQIISEFKYKISLQKSIVFLYTCND